MKDYLLDHINRKLYDSAVSRSSQPGLLQYRNVNGWTDYYIGRHILFSQRNVCYDAGNFPERFHSHDFFEVDIYCGGDVRYVTDHQEITPHRDDILIFPPHCNHTAKLITNGSYERIVLYFSPRFFTDIDAALTPGLFLDSQVRSVSILPAFRGQFFYLLETLKDTLHTAPTGAGLLTYGTLVQLLNMIATCTASNSQNIIDIPPKILDIKRYIDEHFQTITTIDDIAGAFFYSREYISRVFKQYYNIGISEYLRAKRLRYSAELLKQGYNVGYACDAAGFRSMSTFVSAFREKYGFTPVQFKHMCRAKDTGER